MRTKKQGKISPEKAAEVAAQVATLSSTVVMPLKHMWLPTDFCIKFQDGMNRIFKDHYSGYGAQANAR